MRNKFLKGLSVAFAAAMAFTVVAPALTTEAASSKAYVVTEKKYSFNTDDGHANGDVTKYTYDSRGRVIKEVTTSTNGTESNTQQINAGAAGSTETTVKVTQVTEGPTAANQTPVTTTTETTTTNKYQVAKYNRDRKTVTTKTYTYYNSGAKKDKVKSASTTIESKSTVSYVSEVEDASYAYAYGSVDTAETVYTYDSKGNEIQEVETVKDTANYYAPIIVNKVADTGWNEDFGNMANQVFGQAFFDGLNADENIKDFTITETKKVFTNNSQGMHVSVAQTITTGTHDYKQATDTSDDSVTVVEGTAQYTYNKNGFPTKFVQTISGKVVGSNADGSNPWARSNPDSVTTCAYTYGKDLQLAKKTVTTKNPVKLVTFRTNATVSGNTLNPVTNAAGVVTGYTVAGNGVIPASALSTSKNEFNAAYGTVETVVVDNKNNNARVSYSLVTATIYGDDSTTTTTYNPVVKEGTTVKTSEVAKVGDTDNFRSWDYKVKKISVPSSRTAAIMKDQFQKQTDFDW